MKKITLLCLILTSCYVRADMVVTESVEGTGQDMTLIMKIKGDKIRTDVSAQISTLINTTSGETLTIMHPQKTFMKMPADQMKAVMEQMKKFKGQATASETSAAKPKLVNAGKSEKVNGFNAEIYTAETPTTKLTCWVAKDFPNYAAVQQQLKKLQTSSLGKFGADLNSTPDLSDLQGLPVKTQIVTNGQTITVTILSAKEQPVTDAEMEIPADYKEMVMPDFGGMGVQ
ncbi:MAG: DUF4412 domain-containing protein [Verrucomicrobiota bacterium]